MSAFGQHRLGAPLAIKPTDEQQENLDVVHTGVDTVIEAGAGTGKTSQLKMIALNESDRSGLCIYFNRAPAAEARRTFPANVACSTAHSLAWHAMQGRAFMERLEGPPVPPRAIAEDFLGINSWFTDVPKGRKPVSSWKIASMAVNAVKRFCYTDSKKIEPWHVERIEGITGEYEKALRARVLPFAREVWADLQKPDGWAQFTPDHYMKIWALEDPVLEADFMMVDESQDTNGVLAGILRRQTHLQRILVGDSQQRLFSWRGSVDMMQEFKHAEVRYLTQSFRFGDAVAEEANRWLSYLDAPLRLRGLPTINSRLEFVEHPDVVLCRTNADTIEQAMTAQDRGFSVAIVGDVAERMAAFAAAADEMKRGGKPKHRELAAFKTWPDVQAYVREGDADANFATAVRLIERYGTVGVQRVAANCVGERQADYVISTVHKVKGMEWNKVLLDPGLMPDEASDQAELTRGELMVNYVASTRAREVLDVTALEPFHARRARRRELEQAKSAS
jgi:hypothetical protein